MSYNTNNTTQTIQHKYDKTENTLLLYRIGKFYNAYGDNAIILNYLFGYKVLIDCRVGFPETALTKVINTFDDKRIDYQIIYKEDNPTTKKFGNLNGYKKILKQALEYRNIQSRVERIEDKINKITDINILERIIGVIEDELQ